MTIKNIIEQEYNELGIIPLSIDFEDTYGIPKEDFSVSEKQYKAVALASINDMVALNIDVRKYSFLNKYDSIIPNLSYAKITDPSELAKDPGLNAFVSKILPVELSKAIRADSNINRDTVSRSVLNKTCVDTLLLKLNEIAFTQSFIPEVVDVSSEYTANLQADMQHKMKSLVLTLAVMKEEMPSIYKDVKKAFKAYTNRETDIANISGINEMSVEKREKIEDMINENKRLVGIVEQINIKENLPEFSIDNLKKKAFLARETSTYPHFSN